MIIEAMNLYTNTKVKYFIPSKDELIRNSVKTWGKKYDKIEREVVEGGIPTVFNRVE